MGLLDKTNPLATRESVIRNAWMGGATFLLGSLAYCCWHGIESAHWFPIAFFTSSAGAAIAALCEWQLDDGVDFYELILEVQEEFTVELPDWESIETLGQLHRSVVEVLRAQSPCITNEDAIWDQLKSLIVKQLGFQPEKVVPEARFYIDPPM